MSLSLRKWRENLFSVFIGNLHPDVTELDLFNLFSKCGDVKDLVVLEPKVGQRDQINRFGFVRYEKLEEAVQAIKTLNGWSIKSQKIIVDMGHQTFERMKKSELKAPVPAVTAPKAHELLPIVSHIDSIRNMIRLKEACERANSKASSNSAIVKISRISTKLERTPFSDIAHTSRPLKPRPVFDSRDPALDVYKKICEKSSTSSSVSQCQTDSSKSADVLEILSLLFDQLCLPLEKQAASSLEEFNQVSTTLKGSNIKEFAEELKSIPALMQRPGEIISTVCNTKGNPAVIAQATFLETTSSQSPKAFSGDGTDGLCCSPISLKLNVRSTISEKQCPVLKDCAFDKQHCKIEKQRNVFANSAAPQKPSLGFQIQSTSSNSEDTDSCDVSWLPKSLQNSRIARLTGKPLKPAFCSTIRTPFVSPLKLSGYNSEGFSSPESSLLSS